MPEQTALSLSRDRRSPAKVRLLLYRKADFAKALGFSVREFDRLRATGLVPPPEFKPGTPAQRWHRRTVRRTADALCGLPTGGAA